MDLAKLRQAEKDDDLCRTILTTMDGDGPERVVLTGKSGIGKTRLARMVSEHATKSDLCYVTLWLHLNNKFDDELLIYENIAFQIEVYDKDKEGKQGDDLVKDLKEKITAELNRRRKESEEYIKRLKEMEELTKRLNKKYNLEEEMSNTPVKAHLLLILDDEGNKTSEEKVMKDAGLESFLREHAPLKIIITRRERFENLTMSDEDEEINPHSADGTQALLRSLDEDNMRDLFASLISDKAKEVLQYLENSWKLDEPLISCIAQKNRGLPAAIFVLANSLNCITSQKIFKSLSPKQEKVLREVASPCEPDYLVSAHNPILQLAYKLLETDDALNSAIVDCFWHSLDFFKHCGCIHYGELITQWILEGYFDPVWSVKKAYNDGHSILVELIRRGILKIQEGDMIVPEMAMNNLIDLRPRGILGRSQIRFARGYGGDKKKGLGKTTQIDDIIKTVQEKERDNICTILVSGNRLRRETPAEFFKQIAGLQVLILFDPAVEYLTEHLRKLSKLRVLVIRNCGLLSDIEELRYLQGLNVLEVSGASSVETISDDFFASMSGLQTLNLSGLGIKHSPNSISLLTDLHSLILRDCPVLEHLPNITELWKLEVVDVRGAHNLKTCFGERVDRRRNQTFFLLQQLQLLDFSESKIKRLPVFYDAASGRELYSLTRLSLHNCSSLIKLPNLKPLSGLRILDLSGTTKLVDMAAVCFEQKEKLKILNLSDTKLTELPSTICKLSNLSQLLLRDSSNLVTIPNIEGLACLEFFDVSGCTGLRSIEGSFKGMSHLREVNLSGTRIITLPELPEKSSICCSKVIVLADSRRLERDTWGQVKEAIADWMSESLSSSETVDGFQILSRQENPEVGEKELSVPWAFDCPEKKDAHREHHYTGHIYRDVYMNTIPFVDTKSHQEIVEIHGSNGVDQDTEKLANAEYVALVDNSATSLSSIFNNLTSVKGCWLEMCRDIKILFSDVDEERLRHLETLSITNLGWLESICSSSFENLKKLSLDCCPSIITLFPASAPPTSLEVLKIKFCVKLEKVFEEEVELLNLNTLCLFQLPVLSTIGAKLPNLETYRKDNCPKLISSQENLKRGNSSS